MLYTLVHALSIEAPQRPPPPHRTHGCRRPYRASRAPIPLHQLPVSVYDDTTPGPLHPHTYTNTLTYMVIHAGTVTQASSQLPAAIDDALILGRA